MKFKAPQILAALLVGSAGVTLLFWYQVTFSRRLDDSALIAALAPAATVREAQHGIEEITKRFEAGAPGMDRWSALLVETSRRAETPVRRAAAWAMQYAPTRPDFAPRLREMVAEDRDVVVQRMAACSLSQAGDASVRPVLRSMLGNYTVTSPAAGTLDSILPLGRRADQDGLLAKIVLPDRSRVEAPAVVPGRVVEVLVKSGDAVVVGTPLAVLAPDPDHAVNAVVGLGKVGTREDVELLRSLTGPQPPAGPRAAEFAAAAIGAIEARSPK